MAVRRSGRIKFKIWFIAIGEGTSWCGGNIPLRRLRDCSITSKNYSPLLSPRIWCVRAWSSIVDARVLGMSICLEISTIIGIPRNFYLWGVRLFDCLCIYRIDGQKIPNRGLGKVSLKAIAGLANYFKYGRLVWFKQLGFRFGSFMLW